MPNKPIKTRSKKKPLEEEKENQINVSESEIKRSKKEYSNRRALNDQKNEQVDDDRGKCATSRSITSESATINKKSAIQHGFKFRLPVLQARIHLPTLLSNLERALSMQSSNQESASPAVSPAMISKEVQTDLTFSWKLQNSEIQSLFRLRIK